MHFLVKYMQADSGQEATVRYAPDPVSRLQIPFNKRGKNSAKNTHYHQVLRHKSNKFANLRKRL